MVRPRRQPDSERSIANRPKESRLFPESRIMVDMAGPRTDYKTLYRQAFERFGAEALWSSRPVADPTPEDALAITWSLRVEGNLKARLLAEDIEAACRAAY